MSNIWKAAQMLFRKPKYQWISVENSQRKQGTKKCLNIENRPRLQQYKETREPQNEPTKSSHVHHMSVIQNGGNIV